MKVNWCSMRRSPLEEGKRWLEQAGEDLRWAKDLAERGGYHIACFLAQQIGEKAVKAFLYPNSLPDSIPARVYTRDAAREAVALAEEMVGFVRQGLSEMK